jgi:hypothetical protein
MEELQADLRAKRALHYFITTLVCITITVLSVILVIWPQKPFGGDRSTQHWKKVIPCHFALTFFGSWESYIEHDASRCRATTTSCHDHALVRPWSRTYRKLKPKERAIVSNARNLLAAHAATPSQTFLLDTAACDAHLNSFAPPVNNSLRRWFRDAATSAARRSELCRLGFLHARGGFYLDADLQPRHPGALHTHVAGWAGFVAVVAQGWAGLNQTSGRRGPLSLRGSLLGATPGHRLIAKAGEVLAGVLDGGGPHARACAAAAPESRPDGGGVYGCILARALELTCALCALSAPSLRPLCALSAPSLRPLCALSAPSLRPLCALFAPSLRPLCAFSAPSLHAPLQPLAAPCKPPAQLPTLPPACPSPSALQPLPFSPPPCFADPHVHRRLRAPPPLFNFQRERLQFWQEASATAEPEHVLPTPTRFPCTSAACRLVLTAPPSREPIFFSRTGVGTSVT